MFNKMMNKIRGMFGLPKKFMVQGAPLPSNVTFNVKRGKVVGMMLSKPEQKGDLWPADLVDKTVRAELMTVTPIDPARFSK